MLLYIVRHGEPDYVTDTLLPRGVLQAEAVGKRIAAAGISRIFTSPMGRARQTAEPACRLLDLEATVEDWTHEIEDERLTCFPDGVRKSVSLVQNTRYREKGNWDLGYEGAFTCQGFSDTRMKEKIAAIGKAGDGFLERLGYKAEGENYRILLPSEERVALFCHAAFTRAWLSYLLHIPAHLMWAGTDYTHTGVTVLEFANNPDGLTAPRLLCYSDMSHLYAHGPDMLYNSSLPL